MTRRHFTFRAANDQIAAWLLNQGPRARSAAVNAAIRAHIEGKHMTPEANEEIFRIVRELGAIGNNVNQIAKTTNVAAMNGEEMRSLDGLSEEHRYLRSLRGDIERLIAYWR